MTDKRKAFEYRDRVRLLYSLRDFQIARSAATFLSDCDPEKSYSLATMRRFRCYETTMVIAYARPFTESRGTIPQLSLPKTGATLTDEQKALHRRLLGIRNKVFAHSDADMMRMVSKTAPIALSDNFEFTAMKQVFDEGLEFIGLQLHEVRSLIEVIYGSIFAKLLLDAQSRPERFDLHIDHVNRESS